MINYDGELTRKPLRRQIDFTGVVAILNDEDSERSRNVVLPRIKKGLPPGSLDRASNIAAGLGKGDYETFINRVVGFGNPAKRLLVDQQVNWHPLGEVDINRVLREQPSRAEEVTLRIGEWIRQQSNRVPWLRSVATKINLDDFMIDYEGLARMTAPIEGRITRNSIVSGNNYWNYRDVIVKLGDRGCQALDSKLGIILPPHSDVSSPLLKVPSGLWWVEGEKEEVEFEEDDIGMGYLLSIIGRVNMHGKPTPAEQDVAEKIIEESELKNDVKEYNLIFPKAA